MEDHAYNLLLRALDATPKRLGNVHQLVLPLPHQLRLVH